MHSGGLWGHAGQQKSVADTIKEELESQRKTNTAAAAENEEAE